MVDFVAMFQRQVEAQGAAAGQPTTDGA
jgi:hypothetical protein